MAKNDKTQIEENRKRTRAGSRIIRSVREARKTVTKKRQVKPVEPVCVHAVDSDMNLALQVMNTEPPKPTETKVSVDIDRELASKLLDFSIARGLTVQAVIRVATTTMMKANRFYDLDTRIAFGKYVGEPMETIIRLDPEYVRWAMENISGLGLTVACQNLLSDMLMVVNPDRGDHPDA